MLDSSLGLEVTATSENLWIQYIRVLFTIKIKAKASDQGATVPEPL